MRRSLNSPSALETAVTGAAVFGGGASSLTCATSVAGTASVFSMSKETTLWGLPSSSTVKSSDFKLRTKFPLLSRTVTLTSTSSVSAWKVKSSSWEGSAGQSRARVSSSARSCMGTTSWGKSSHVFQWARHRQCSGQRHRTPVCVAGGFDESYDPSGLKSLRMTNLSHCATTTNLCGSSLLSLGRRDAGAT